MASMSMTASFFPAATKLSSTTAGGRRGLLVVKASGERTNLELKVNEKVNQESSSTTTTMRRDLMFAAAAAAVCSLARVAMADEEEPKAGTLQAKKKYAPVCVTMPTARICRN